MKWILTALAIVLGVAGYYYGRQTGYRDGHQSGAQDQRADELKRDGGQDSSPIIVANGSVHFRQQDKGISQRPSNGDTYIGLTGHKVNDIVVRNCKPGHGHDDQDDQGKNPDCSKFLPPNPPFNPSDFPDHTWTLKLYKDTDQKDANLLATLQTADLYTLDDIEVTPADGYKFQSESDDLQDGDKQSYQLCAKGRDGNCKADAPPVKSAMVTVNGKDHVLACSDDPDSTAKGPCIIRLKYCRVHGTECK
jgi:hypothetical protein